MRTRFVEATQDIERGFNHGKFMIAAFDQDEWDRRCEVDANYDPSRAASSLLARCGWSGEHVLVFDLQTGEGALFLPGGMPQADLDKHRVWVCPMFEPFLAWLYQQAKGALWLTTLPALVELPAAPAAMAGYRREGS